MNIGDQIGELQVEEVVLVQENTPVERLDRFAASVFVSLPSRSSARKAAQRGELAINGEVAAAHRFVNPGDRIGRLQTTRVALSVVDIELDVVYEDEWVAAISKPPGLMTSGFAPRTAARALPGCLSPSSRPDALPAPWPAHRLDAPTGGLLLIAKTATAASALGKSFQNREVFKRYRALLTGRLDGEGEVTEALDERACHTRYRAVEHVRSLRYGWLTEVDMWPLTGRTHQLRRHMAGLGVPILGDRRYGTRGAIYRSKGLFLWAVELEVPHPDGTRRLHIEIPPPAKFATHQARETRRWLRHHPEPEDESA